jgi:hypothetical protein
MSSIRARETRAALANAPKIACSGTCRSRKAANPQSANPPLLVQTPEQKLNLTGKSPVLVGPNNRQAPPPEGLEPQPLHQVNWAALWLVLSAVHQYARHLLLHVGRAAATRRAARPGCADQFAYADQFLVA